MIKKVIRPFWSLDIIKTETWLSEMAIRGYRLEKMNLITREFVFENDERKTIQYRICRQKAGVSATSQSLIKSQWYCVFSKGKWSILANENEASKIKIYPSRESILKRNRTMKYSIGILLAYMAFNQIQTIFLLASILSPNDFSPFLRPGFILERLLVVSSLSYIIVKLNKSDKKIRMEYGSDLTIPMRTILDRKTERALRKEGRLIKKIKLAWMYAPDKVEKWLEDMEMEGYNLVRMSWSGNTFYFIKGESRTIKYCTDFQNLVNDSYFEIHKSNGWEMIFTSQSPLMKYTLWKKEYTDEKPELYSDKSHILKHARKQCLLYCVLYIPLIIMYIQLLVSTFRMFSMGMLMVWYTPILLTLLLIEFGYFTIQSLGYYLRTRKRIK
ncbi:MAG: DUF2812 domain-containing protein [Desulfitobacteriaceae bacterium]